MRCHREKRDCQETRRAREGLRTQSVRDLRCIGRGRGRCPACDRKRDRQAPWKKSRAPRSQAGVVAVSDPLSSARLIVVKVGSSLLVEPQNGTLRRGWLESLCADVAALRGDGKNVILVSSGAIALGRRALKLRPGPLKLEESQAAAAAGQVRLAEAYADILASAGIVAAQIL